MSFRRQRKPRVAERQHGRVLKFSPNRVYVLFHDGTARSMPSLPFINAGVGVEQSFVLLIYRDDAGKVESVAVQRVEPAAVRRSEGQMPKIMVREGRRLTTRR